MVFAYISILVVTIYFCFSSGNNFDHLHQPVKLENDYTNELLMNVSETEIFQKECTIMASKPDRNKNDVTWFSNGSEMIYIDTTILNTDDATTIQCGKMMELKCNYQDDNISIQDDNFGNSTVYPYYYSTSYYSYYNHDDDYYSSGYSDSSRSINNGGAIGGSDVDVVERKHSQLRGSSKINVENKSKQTNSISSYDCSNEISNLINIVKTECTTQLMNTMNYEYTDSYSSSMIASAARVYDCPNSLSGNKTGKISKNYIKFICLLLW